MTTPITFDGQIHREMTPDELAQYEADNEAHAAVATALEAQAAARDSALSKLTALGLTEQEVAALLGA